MATLHIEIPDQKAAALKAYAQAQGLSVEKWLVQLAEQAGRSFLLENQSPDTRPIWEVIQDNMKNVPPEGLAALPRDGASQIDLSRRRHISEVIRDNMRDVPPEDLAALPSDGASQHDHYIYGVPKRAE